MMVEVVVAIAIITTSIFACMAVSNRAISVSKQALHMTQANFLLEEGAEAVRIIRDTNWTNISSLNTATSYYPTYSAGAWTLPTTSSQVGIFTRKINIAAVNRVAGTDDISGSGTDDPGTKLITVTVSWVEGGQTMSKYLKFYILNIF